MERNYFLGINGTPFVCIVAIRVNNSAHGDPVISVLESLMCTFYVLMNHLLTVFLRFHNHDHSDVF